MKLLVETTGTFQLVDEKTGHLIRHHGKSVVPPSPFINERTGTGQLTVVAKVNDEATDAEWLKYAKESNGDDELAVESFVSAFPIEKPAPAPAPAPTSVSVDTSASPKRGK